ncbi:cache domain-containing protein [uncultured Pseudodesulfovibrio sp.]|uniref:cache domain-containing protein n=1 Tax=uncultured Pseudodesulfovibrio sp. TaxID=2035858 RepID=UPI0029C96433|nr:cache domain-containing protein [uncultured Pseudodesulfovibrio sp.]
MSKGRTIGRAGLFGMIAVSWVSIAVIGGVWLYFMLADFTVDADRIREERYEERRDLVKNEVQDALELVGRIRQASSENLLRKLEAKIRDVRALNEVLGRDLAKGTDPTMVRVATVRLMAALDRSEARLYAIRGKTIYLFSPFPKWLNREDALSQVETELDGVTNGQRKLGLKVADGMNRYTLLVKVNEFKAQGLRVVAGACLEMAEESVKELVLRRLGDIRYAKNSALFGGTMEGESILGPVVGQNMWNITDANGVKIVQELIKAAKRGGGFVSYVMPPLGGQRNEPKVSYAEAIPDWGWYIGTGAFVGDIEGVVELKRKQLEQHIQDRVLLILSGMVLLGLLAFILSRRMARNIETNVASFTKVWERAASGQGEIEVASLDYAEFKSLAEAANNMVAERQAVQEALTQSLERFSSVVANIPGIVYHTDFENGWVNHFVSGTALDVTGYPAEEFMEGGSRSFVNIIHPEDRDWVERSLRQGLENRQTYIADYRIIRRDGEIRWLSDRGRILHDDDGRPVRIDGVIFDVTDRKHAEEEYYNHIHFLETLDRIDRAMHSGTSTDEMLAATVDAIRQAFGADRAWLVHPCDPDADTFLIKVLRTDSEYELTGTEGTEMALTDKTRRDFRTLLENNTAMAFDPSTGLPMDEQLIEEYGVRSQLMYAIRPSMGTPWCLGLHHCRDARVWTDEEVRLFTEVGRRLSDGLNVSLVLDQLSESEERFRTFSEQTMLGLCVLQEDRVTFVNKAAADILETTVEELMALPPGGFVRYLHPDDSDFVMDQARRKQAGDPDTLMAYTWRAVTGTGRVKWVNIHSRTTKVNGALADLMSLVDITTLKRAEEDLEAIIAERTSDLALKAEELKQANAELTRLDDLKSSFLTTVSHAMRTPLTSVLGYGTLARRELDRSINGAGNGEGLQRALSNLDVLEIEGRRLNLLIDQFMELADMEAGGNLRTDKAHSMEEPIRQAVESARQVCQDRAELEVVLDMEDNLPKLNILPEHLKRVLGHLLGNACTFTDEGSITVRVTSPDGKGLELAVADTGKGIPQAELEAIFKPFHQVETGDTLVDEIKGAGLGLALCRMVVEKLGGRVWARSRADKGAVFYVSLPGARS